MTDELWSAIDGALAERFPDTGSGLADEPRNRTDAERRLTMVLGWLADLEPETGARFLAYVRRATRYHEDQQQQFELDQERARQARLREQ